MNWTRICYPDGHLDLCSLRFVSPLRPALLGQIGRFLPGLCTHRASTTRFPRRSVLFPADFLARGRAVVLALSRSPELFWPGPACTRLGQCFLNDAVLYPTGSTYPATASPTSKC